MGLEENVRQKQAAVDSLKKSLEAAKKANAGLSVEMGIKEQISGRPIPQPETPPQSGSSVVPDSVKTGLALEEKKQYIISQEKDLQGYWYSPAVTDTIEWLMRGEDLGTLFSHSFLDNLTDEERVIVMRLMYDSATLTQYEIDSHFRNGGTAFFVEEITKEKLVRSGVSADHIDEFLLSLLNSQLNYAAHGFTLGDLVAMDMERFAQNQANTVVVAGVAANNVYAGSSGYAIYDPPKNGVPKPETGGQSGIGDKGIKPDFYITPKGDVIPSTGYRYISENATYLGDISTNMVIPANADGTYFSFSNYDIANPGALQVPHDASIKTSFDTLQIIDDISIPYGNWGRAPYLEPITRDFPQFGDGGATQAITHSGIKVDLITRLPKK